MITLYINLEKDAGRREVMEERLEWVGLEGYRIDAIDGLDMPPEWLPRFDAHYFLDPGALGCYASHMKAWERLLETGQPSALILEDDAILHDGIVGILEDTLDALPAGWDYVHLDKEPDRATCTFARLRGNRKIVRYSRIPPGAVGYLISQEGARKLLADQKRLWPLDTDTRRPWLFGCLDVYGLTPAPISHNDLAPSSIGDRRKKRWGCRRHGLRGIYDNPLRNLDSLRFNWRQLGGAHWARCFVVNSALKLRSAFAA